MKESGISSSFDIDHYLNKIGQKKEESHFGRTMGIHNSARKGKTLTAVFLIVYYLERLDYIKGVISNVAINLSKIDRENDYISLKDIKNIKKEEYKNYIIFIDEFRRIIDARMSGSFKNRFVSNLMADTGKFSQIVLITDQEASAIDKRIRRNADAVLVPTVNFKTGLCNVKVLNGYNQYFVMDGYGMLDNPELPSFDFEFRKYYDFYDTEQPIDDFFLTFEPKDFMELFLSWMHEKKYDERDDISINKSLLMLWKETTGIEITSEQLSALLVYMYLEKPELDVDYRGKKKHEG